jgi:ATP synthase H subunit
LAYEAIMTIKNAENEAKELVSEARKRAAQILKDGKDRADNIIAEARLQAENQGRLMVEEAKKSCEKEVDKLREEYNKRRINLESIAMGNIDKAAQFIMERIVTRNGDS